MATLSGVNRIIWAAPYNPEERAGRIGMESLTFFDLWIGKGGQQKWYVIVLKDLNRRQAEQKIKSVIEQLLSIDSDSYEEFFNQNGKILSLAHLEEEIQKVAP